MIYALGKVEDEKTLLFFTKLDDRIVGVPSSSLSKSLMTGLAEVAAEVAADAAAEGLENALDNVPGGGLIAGLVGDKVEEAAINKMVDLISDVTDKLSDEEIADLIKNEDAEVEVPLDKLKSTKGKTKGLVSKKFMVTVKVKGFWIFSTTHELVFRLDQKENAEKVFLS